jgi:RNA polymerase sigma-70 factor (ECF subfamily)
MPAEGNPPAHDPAPATPGDCFVTTRWTVVLAAGRDSTADSDRALAELCQTYWYPLYAYTRRQGHTHEDAEDLTQAFFARFLERNYLAGLDAERGRFRAFLLACLKNFLANEHDKASRQKRGGGIPPLSLDWQSAEDRFRLEPADPRSPDRAFDREWALALLGRVVARIEDEFANEGKGAFFARAKGFLTTTEDAATHEQVARELGMEPGAVRVAVHRLRKRYRELLRDEIAQTLADPARVAEELRALQAALAGP